MDFLDIVHPVIQASSILYPHMRRLNMTQNEMQFPVQSSLSWADRDASSTHCVHKSIPLRSEELMILFVCRVPRCFGSGRSGASKTEPEDAKNIQFLPVCQKRIQKKWHTSIIRFICNFISCMCN